MKRSTLTITIILATLTFGLLTITGPTTGAFAYSDEELIQSWKPSTLPDYTHQARPDVQRQNQEWALRNQAIDRDQQRRSAESAARQFNPRDFSGSPPMHNTFQNGKTQTCQRGAPNGAIFCY